MTTLLAIDPGTSTGFAFFNGGMLVKAGAAKRDVFAYDPALFLPQMPDKVLIEKPQAYQGDKSQVPYNALLTLAWLGGGLEWYFRRHDIATDCVLPKTWKGTVNKGVMSRRIEHRWMTDEDRDVIPTIAKSYKHNMLDAIGIGIWWLRKNGERRA